MDDETNEYLFKILVVGDSATGKTSIIRRSVFNTYTENYKSTIGVDFALKIINYNGKIVQLQLWDIAGQERYGNLTRIYFKEASGAFIVFDLCMNDTFENVLKWKHEIDDKVKLPNNQNIPVILLANKCDSPKNAFIVTNKELDDFCEENGFIGWELVSAKENINISKSMKFLVEYLMKLSMEFNESLNNKISENSKLKNKQCC